MPDHSLNFMEIFRKLPFFARAGRNFPIQCAAVLLLLGTLNGVIYFRALCHPFKVDQMTYMADLKGQTSLSAGLARLDYSNVRVYWKGDETLYRPLLLGWLGILNHFFGYHYHYWNAAQIGLHALVSFCLFLLFLQSAGSGWALLFCLAFSVSPHLFEMNTEPHVGGYLWGFILFLLLVSQIFRMENQDSAWTKPQIAALAMMSTLCVFFYEIFIPLTAVALLYLVLARRLNQKTGGTWKQAMVLCVPFLAFMTAYLIHGFQSERFFYIDMHGAPAVSSLKAKIEFMLNTCRNVFLNWLAIFFRPASAAEHFFYISGIIAWAASAVSLRSREKIRRAIFFIVCLGVYLAILCSGRPAPYMHHYYFFLLLGWLIIFNTVDLKRFPRTVSILLLGLVVSGIWTTWNKSDAVERNNGQSFRYFIKLMQFVDQHKKESDFSFKITGKDREPLDSTHSLKFGYPDQPGTAFNKRVSEILFARYYDSLAPKYELAWADHSLKVSRQRHADKK